MFFFFVGSSLACFDAFRDVSFDDFTSMTPLAAPHPVFQSIWKSKSKPVVLKCAPHTNGKELRQLTNEACILSKYPMDEFVHVYGRTKSPSLECLVLKRYQQDAFSWIMSNFGQPDYKTRAREMAYQMARAVKVAHDNGILHLDIKPENFLINSDEMPILTDFAYAEDLSQGIAMGESKGTGHYMDPSFWVDTDIHIYGPENDIYSLGVTFHTMFAKTFPYREGPPVPHRRMKQTSYIHFYLNDPMLIDLLNRMMKGDHRLTDMEFVLNHPFFNQVHVSGEDTDAIHLYYNNINNSHK